MHLSRPGLEVLGQWLLRNNSMTNLFQVSELKGPLFHRLYLSFMITFLLHSALTPPCNHLSSKCGDEMRMRNSTTWTLSEHTQFYFIPVSKREKNFPNQVGSLDFLTAFCWLRCVHSGSQNWWCFCQVCLNTMLLKEGFCCTSFWEHCFL